MKCPKCATETFNWRSRCPTCGEKLHPEDKLSGSFSSPKPTWIAYLIAVPVTILLGFFIFLAVGLSSGSPIIYFGLLVLPFVSLLLGWRWPLIGGVLMLIEGCLLLGLMIYTQAIGGNWTIWTNVFWSVFIVIPFLVAGIFLISVRR